MTGTVEAQGIREPPMPRWLLGCLLYRNPYAGPGEAIVADCSVEGSGGSHRLLEELRHFLAEALGAPLAVVGYGMEGLGRRRYLVRKAALAGGGELRIVEEEGRLLLAAAVIPPETLPPAALSAITEQGVRLGEPLEPPVLAAPRRPRLQQPLLTRPPVYIAEEEVPSHPGVLRVTRGDRVLLEASIEEIVEKSTPVEKPMHCVTGWTTSKVWRATPLRELTSIPPEGWALAISVGGYTASIPAQLLREALLVTGMDAEPLPHDHGGPLRLLVPSLYGWKSVKWLTEIRIETSYIDGYWEARGYHERGLVEKEERFKTRNPGLL